MSIINFDDERHILFYEAGQCSLDEINNIFLEEGVYWYQMQPIFKKIITEISTTFIKLLQMGIYHSDMKPANIVFYIKFGKLSQHVKLIDFGCSTMDFSEFLGGTPGFFQPGKTKFASKEEREIAELYTLGRTLLVTAMGSIIDNMCHAYCSIHSITDQI